MEAKLKQRITEHFLKAFLCNSLSDFLALIKIMEETNAIAEITPLDLVQKPRTV